MRRIMSIHYCAKIWDVAGSLKSIKCVLLFESSQSLARRSPTSSAPLGAGLRSGGLEHPPRVSALCKPLQAVLSSAPVSRASSKTDLSSGDPGSALGGSVAVCAAALAVPSSWSSGASSTGAEFRSSVDVSVVHCSKLTSKISILRSNRTYHVRQVCHHGHRAHISRISS